MATAQEMRSSAKTATITSAQSTTLVKNIFRAAFSTIAYIRSFFDDDCFEIGKIGPTKYHKLKTLKNEDVRTFADCLERGVFDALQRKYLEVVLLEVYAGDAKAEGRNKMKELLECFSFSVSYGSGGAQLSLSDRDATSAPFESKEQIKQTTAEVLRSLVDLASTLRPLPANRILSIKLYYTPETPTEYEPPMFKAASPEWDCWFNGKPLRISAGVVATPYHQLCMTVRAQASDENKMARVLNECADNELVENDGRVEKMDAETKEMTLDVGGSQGNSGRVFPAKIVKETQDKDMTEDENSDSENQAKEKQDTVECKIRVKASAEGLVGKTKKRGRGPGSVSVVGRKKRKASICNKTISPRQS